MTFEIDSNQNYKKFFCLEFKGFGSIKVQIFLNRNSKVPIREQKLILNNSKEFSLVPLSHGQFSTRGRILKILKVAHVAFMEDFIFRLTEKEFIEMNFNDNTKVYSGFSNTFNFLLKGVSKMADKDKQNRI